MSDVTSYRVTGDWRHVVDDGMVDPDDLPDEALPTGSVLFTPVGPSIAVAGAPAVGYTFGPATALVAAGELRDLQGRTGIMLAGSVGDETVRWRARVRLSWQGQEVAEWEILFDLDGDLRLSAERPDDGVGLPELVVSRAVAAADRADKAAGRAETAVNSFGLTATSTTGAPGSPADVDVIGDGPVYELSLTIPQGDKGDPGTTQWDGIEGKPSTFPPATHTHTDKADLVGGQVPTSQLPAVALTKPFPVADRAAMLALTAQEGDVAVVTGGADKGTYMLGDGPASLFGSWVKLTTPDAPVQSVNGQTGTVNLNAANVGAKPSSYVPAWSEVTSKPATFPPTIGTSASTAKAGNYVPAWSEVTGKPSTFPPGTHSHTAADTGAVARQGAAQALWIGTEGALPATGTTGVLYVTY